MCASRNHQGRRATLTELRELLALLGALQDEHQTISPTTIAQKLGVNESHASELLDRLFMAGGASQVYLPLYYVNESEGVVALDSRGSIRGKPLRLTKSESTALETALDLLGIDVEDPLRKRLSKAFYTETPDRSEIRRLLAQPISEHDAKQLYSSVEAIVSGDSISFLYQGERDEQPIRRSVVPTAVYRHDNRWYVVGLDLQRAATRTFRADRMNETVLGDQATSQANTPTTRETIECLDTQSDQPRARVVTLVLRDPKYLSLFEWPGLHVIRHDRRSVVATIPYYGTTTWLPRTIAACGGTVTTTENALNEEVLQYASTLRDELEDNGNTSPPSSTQGD